MTHHSANNHPTYLYAMQGVTQHDDWYTAGVNNTSRHRTVGHVKSDGPTSFGVNIDTGKHKKKLCLIKGEKKKLKTRSAGEGSSQGTARQHTLFRPHPGPESETGYKMRIHIISESISTGSFSPLKPYILKLFTLSSSSYYLVYVGGTREMYSSHRTLRTTSENH